MGRKNLLAGLTDRKLTAVNSEAEASKGKLPPLGFTGRGALGAVTRSIDELAAKAQIARQLEAQLLAGQAVVELDSAVVDPSFMTDRMTQDEDALSTLRNAIAGQGQISPILVRPHPSVPNRFQVAFGHRRLRIAQELGQPVRAVIRPLSDRELILAQGQENSARTDLSFIERARFAWRLENGGYDRDTIMAALAVDKTTVSRMISVASCVPTEVIEAIGPAPAIGRDRWVDLAGLFEVRQPRPELGRLLGSDAFVSATSDLRFAQLHELLSSPGSKSPKPGSGGTAAPSYWTSRDGTRIIRISANSKSVVLAIDKAKAPGFGDFLLTRMERLLEEYRTEHSLAGSEVAKTAGSAKQKRRRR
jgi:ParB family chromosome partitioning protein